MASTSVIELVSRDELNGFLRCAQEADWVLVKVGGTAMKSIVEAGEESPVLKGIREIQSKYNKKIVLVVSAAGKYQKNTLKITQRLLKVLEFFQHGDFDNGSALLQSLENDHMQMARDGAAPTAPIITRHFDQLRAFLNLFRQGELVIPQTFALDMVAGFGGRSCIRFARSDHKWKTSINSINACEQ